MANKRVNLLAIEKIYMLFNYFTGIAFKVSVSQLKNSFTEATFHFFVG
jgi:hypothetical protein